MSSSQTDFKTGQPHRFSNQIKRLCSCKFLILFVLPKLVKDCAPPAFQNFEHAAGDGSAVVMTVSSCGARAGGPKFDVDTSETVY